jgi:geranylgeranyl diphosphate synthase type 3
VERPWSANPSDELLNLHRGQGMDLYWRDSLTCPTEEEYVQMVLGSESISRVTAPPAAKTRNGGFVPHSRQAHDGSLGFRHVSNVSSWWILVLTHPSDYVPLVNLISIYFQIRDDYMNLQSTEYADNKGFAEDLTEGKFSFPVVHGVRADPSNRQILSEWL